jgi:hypothetical protein
LLIAEALEKQVKKGVKYSSGEGSRSLGVFSVKHKSRGESV